MEINVKNYESALREGLRDLRASLASSDPVSNVHRNDDYVGDLTDIFGDKDNAKMLVDLRSYYNGNSFSAPRLPDVIKKMDNMFGRNLEKLVCKPNLQQPKFSPKHLFKAMLVNMISNYLSDDLLNSDSIMLVVTDFEKIQDLTSAFKDNRDYKAIIKIHNYYDSQQRPSQAAVNKMLTSKFKPLINWSTKDYNPPVTD